MAINFRKYVSSFGIGAGIGLLLPALDASSLSQIQNISLDKILTYISVPILTGTLGVLLKIVYDYDLDDKPIEKTDAIATPVFDTKSKFYQSDITGVLDKDEELCEEKDLPYKFQRC